MEEITAFIHTPPPKQLKTNTSSHNSPNGSDSERLNDPKTAPKEDDESESDSSKSNKNTNERDNSTAIGPHSSSAHLKCRRKRSAPGEAKRLQAKRAELFKDSINKETLDYVYICYMVNANAHFSQVEHPDF